MLTQEEHHAAGQPDLAAFRNPGPAYRPILFWLWNEDVDLATLRAQIADFAEKGLGGFFIHAMPDAFRKRDFISGIQQPYMGEAYLQWVRAAAEYAREYGLSCWLYDEGGWPSGTFVGTLAQNRPEWAGQVLRRQVLSPEEASPSLPGEEVARLAGLGGHTLRFYASREGYPTDLMNPSVTEAFLASTHEKYMAALGDDPSLPIPGLFTDEARVAGRMVSEAIPWTSALPHAFRTRKGYDLLPYLPALFPPLPPTVAPPMPPEKVARVRYDFGDVWTQLHADSFYGRIHKWCQEHGLLFTGHVGGEEDLLNHGGQLFGHFFRVMRHLDVPGVDAIWRQVFPGQPHAHFSKYASSAAHIQGKPLALSETFAVYGYGLTFRQMKWVTDRQFGDGINVLAPMAAWYATTRGRIYGTMSHLAWGNPQWRLFRIYADYVARLSYLLRLGKPTAPVAMLYTASSLWIERDPAIAESLEAATNLLQEAQIDFDYVDEDALASATVQEGTLRVGPQTYQAVVVPRTLALPVGVLERLRQLCSEGGAVVLLDAPPRFVLEEPSEPTCQLIRELFHQAKDRCRFLSVDERPRLPEVVRELIQPDLVLDTPNGAIRTCHRKLDPGDLYFVVNASDIPQEIWATMAGTGAVEVWDPDRGTAFSVPAQESGNCVRVHLVLPPLGALFVIIGRAGEALPVVLDGAVEEVRALHGPWERAIVSAARLVEGEPREESVPLGAETWVPTDLRPWADLGLAEFSGSMAYRCTFALSPEEVQGRAWLDLGEVKYNAEVTLNGRAVGVRVWPPYTLEVSGYLRVGRNELRLVVTNTWANQFLRPEAIALAKDRGWYNPYAQRAEPFQRESLESGLLGPVVLRLARRTDAKP